MDKRIKKRWVEALRSGKYEQVRGRLGSEGGMCCLGVLCEVTPRISRREWQDLYSDGTSGLTVPEETGGFSHTYDTSLPSRLLNRYGLEVEEEETLIDMNDAQRASFEQIADYIEANL